jgi:hypothetical protein
LFAGTANAVDHQEGQAALVHWRKVMKLYYGALSPFVRKVMVLAHEKNMLDRIERVPAPLTPLEPNADLMRANPLGEIPALTLDDGMVLFDSPVICEYLDRERLAAWYETFSTRPSMSSTAPQAS